MLLRRNHASLVLRRWRSRQLRLQQLWHRQSSAPHQLPWCRRQPRQLYCRCRLHSCSTSNWTLHPWRMRRSGNWAWKLINCQVIFKMDIHLSWCCLHYFLFDVWFIWVLHCNEFFFKQNFILNKQLCILLQQFHWLSLCLLLCVLRLFNYHSISVMIVLTVEFT